MSHWQASFRTQLDDAILSVSRNGQRIEQKVGSEAAKGFVCRHLYNRDFLLLSRMDDISIPSIKRAPIPFAKSLYLSVWW